MDRLVRLHRHRVPQWQSDPPPTSDTVCHACAEQGAGPRTAGPLPALHSQHHFGYFCWDLNRNSSEPGAHRSFRCIDPPGFWIWVCFSQLIPVLDFLCCILSVLHYAYSVTMSMPALASRLCPAPLHTHSQTHTESLLCVVFSLYSLVSYSVYSLL